MPIKSRQGGATLLELMIAVVMAAAVIVVMSLTIPKSSANITNNRRHWFANQFASTRLQELKVQPYALLQVTLAAAFSVADCDCS